MSFHHVEWVPLKQIEGEHLGKHRVKKFLQKWNAEGQRGEDFRDHLKVGYTKKGGHARRKMFIDVLCL